MKSLSLRFWTLTLSTSSCMLYGKVPVKKKGWNAGVGPAGELLVCRGLACSSAASAGDGQMEPLGTTGLGTLGTNGWGALGTAGMGMLGTTGLGILGTTGREHSGAAGGGGGVGSCSTVACAGKSCSLLHDVGVQMLST